MYPGWLIITTPDLYKAQDYSHLAESPPTIPVALITNVTPHKATNCTIEWLVGSTERRITVTWSRNEILKRMTEAAQSESAITLAGSTNNPYR